MRGFAAVVFVMFAACGGGDGNDGDCSDGEERACYRGPSDTRNVGTCADGVERCSGGRWSGVCLGDVTPFVEKCNGADDDCNGMIDDAETTGEACVGVDGCTGMRACMGESIGCMSPGKNECGLCDGPAVSGLGGTCSNEVCSGAMVCSMDKTAAVCNAPQQNACELCGGPTISGLGDACVAASGCDGALVCNASGTNTTCSCNPVPGQCKDAGGNLRAVDSPAVGDLVITEVMASPNVVDDNDGEWFEVLVMRDLDLNQVGLDRASDTAAPNVIQSANCLRVTAGTRLVFARNVDTTMNGGLPPVTARFTFTMISGTQAAPGDARVMLDTTVIDAVTWIGATDGAARQLDPDATNATANDSTSNFCDATMPYSADNLGTPGAANTQCALLPPAGSCLDAGAPRLITKPQAGALVITEFLANPEGATDSVREWFEITNTSNASFDLNGLVVARNGTTGTTINSPSCIAVGAGGFAVIARSNDPAQNGMLPAVDATFGFSIVDSNGDLEMRDGTTVLDAITYTTGVATSGTARALDPDNTTTLANDLASSTAWCAATSTYGDGTNRGTPRAANPQCP